jgi:aminopeptidase YwaD
LMPKNYPYYYPEEHKKIHELLEQKAAAAILTATGKHHSTAGALYPYPMFEDGDFDIPSVYMKDVEGERLAQFVGQPADLLSEAQRIPSTGCNIVGRKGGGSGRRVLLTSHIDAKIGTPGALDNAGGTIMLMLMAELLQDYEGNLEVETVPFNGEDYYGANGERLYMERNQERLENILLVVNMDGLGYIEGRTAYSLYGPPDAVAELIHKTFADREGFMEGPPWYQGDHSIFIQQGVPAMAITLEHFEYAWEHIAHTERDTPDLVDPARLVETALGLRELIRELQGVE